MTTVQSRNGHSWARDLLSPLRSRSRAFRYHLSAIVVAPAAGPSFSAVWHTVHPLLAAVVRPRVQFYQNCTSHYQIHSVGAPIPAGGLQGRPAASFVGGDNQNAAELAPLCGEMDAIAVTDNAEGVVCKLLR